MLAIGLSITAVVVSIAAAVLGLTGIVLMVGCIKLTNQMRADVRVLLTSRNVHEVQAKLREWDNAH
jgi:hypothetical protein